MSDFVNALAMMAALFLPAPVPAPQDAGHNWCTVGYTVMVPDGREGVVTSKQGDICRVLAYGEAYVTPIPYYIVEPVYPQAMLLPRAFGH